MPSVSRKAALLSVKISVAREKDARVSLAITDHVLRARCLEECVKELNEARANDWVSKCRAERL